MIELAHECKLAFDILYKAYSDACQKQESKKHRAKNNCYRRAGKNEAWLKLKAKIMDVSIEIPLCVDAELVGNAAIVFFSAFTQVFKKQHKIYEIKNYFSLNH